MTQKNKTLVQEYAKEVWLNYFNRVLFEQGIITELQKNEMTNLIRKDCHKKRNT